MNKPPMTPDENRIEELLAKFQPVPSEGFHKKMKQVIWQAGEKRVVKKVRCNPVGSRCVSILTPQHAERETVVIELQCSGS